MTKKHFKRISDDNFSYIKELQKAGRTTSEIKNITGRSTGTLSVILKSATREEYLNNIRRFHRSQVQAEVPQQTARLSMDEQLKILDSCFDELKRQVIATITMGAEVKAMEKVMVLEEELKDLREFKETAVSKNWLDTIKKGLTGNQIANHKQV